MLADELDTSFSPGQLVIHDLENSDRADNEEAEPSVIEISPALPDLSLMSFSDPKIMGNPENTVTPPVSQSNSPRFTAFLLRSEDASDPTERPEVVSGENPPNIQVSLNRMRLQISKWKHQDPLLRHHKN